MTRKFEKDVNLDSSVVENKTKTLFDPTNPSKLVIVTDQTNSRTKNDIDTLFLNSCVVQKNSSLKPKGTVIITDKGVFLSLNCFNRIFILVINTFYRFIDLLLILH